MRILIFIFFSILIIGCQQEDFSPIAKYDQKLAISCIIDSREDSHLLLIQKNSDSWNVEDRLNIPKNISAKLIFKDTVYTFKDTIINGVTNFKCFYFKKANLPSGYYTLQIYDSSSATYKNVSSQIYYPNQMSFKVTIKSPYYEFGRIANNNKFHTYIFYKQKINDEWVLQKEELPFVLGTFDGKEILFFPGDKFQTDKTKLYRIPFRYVYDCVERILSYADSENLTILGGYTIFENYDYNFAQYLMTINTISDPYSVRLDKPTFNNITNGVGIFGAVRIDTVKYFISIRGSHEIP